MNDANVTSKRKKTPGQATVPVSLRFNGASNPNRVPRGGNKHKDPVADALNASGAIVPNVSGDYTLLRVTPPSPGVSVFDVAAGYLNGTVLINNVQNDMIIEVLLTTHTTPAVKGIYTVVVEVIG